MFSIRFDQGGFVTLGDCAGFQQECSPSSSAGG
jgi:hypothetical protein